MHHRKDVLSGLYLFGESHRFIHLLLKARGCTVVEIPVEHHERRFGKSKYGLSRIFKGILDLLVLKYRDRASVKDLRERYGYNSDSAGRPISRAIL